MRPNNFAQTNITKLLHSPSITIKHLQQIHAHFLLLRSPPPSISASLIAAYAASFLPAHAFAFFAAYSPPHPNQFTLQSLLKASSRTKSTTTTAQLHCLSSKLGFTNSTRIQNALLHCYSTCGRLSDARQVFDEMPRQDTVSFNSMIHCYTESGDLHSAYRLFEQAPEPNHITWTAMIAGYSRAGDVITARQLFNTMPVRDIVAWNAMISGYVQNQEPIAALSLFGQMAAERFKPNTVTIVSVLSACAGAGALDAGKWMHAFINKSKFRLDPFLGTALVDMYSKCGDVEFALDVFGNMGEKNVCTWNAMINGLAMNGHAEQALHVFSQLESDRRVKPDGVTFVGVLTACSHGGFLEVGRRHFYCIAEKYGVELIVEHYACMVDLLARCGLLKEAEELIRSMPIAPDDVVWRALLGGCKLHKDVELAERIVPEMEAHLSGDYVLLSNLYGSVGRWDDVEKVRKVMKEKGIEKTPGCSSIEIGNTIYEFISGEKSHPRYKEIHNKLVELGEEMSREGYRAETTEVAYDIDEEEKEHVLGHHSEKLAIAFGLICSAPGATLRIVKNLRICIDCHNAIKLISKMCNCKVVIRDRVRFHHMRDGICSCNDFW